MRQLEKFMVNIKLPLTENHKTRPLNSLGKYKRTTEKFINSRINSKDKFIILRIFNIYGPGQKDNFLIPTIFNQIKNNLNKHQCTILLVILLTKEIIYLLMI